MLSQSQIIELGKRFEISDIVIFREYTQLLFLKELMNQNYAKNIFFKGGTAIRLLFGGERFSEDLDFSVQGSADLFVPIFQEFCDGLEKRWDWKFNKRNTHIGQTWVLSTSMSNQTPCFVKLDFSFREQILMPEKSIISTFYPIVFTSYINHLSKEEILSEKIRAVMTRKKGRDLYDLWFLLSQSVELQQELIEEKLNYYHLSSFKAEDLMLRIKTFDPKQFILDIRPFISRSKREKLKEFFNFMLDVIGQKVQATI